MQLVLFNLLCILLVGIIAYWWANQGLFSAIIHLLCVVTAGALAFAFWERLTLGLLLRGSWFDGYAWRPVACGGCGLFLGWRFETVAGSRPPDFYGLLEERLVSREGPGTPPDR